MNVNATAAGTWFQGLSARCAVGHPRQPGRGRRGHGAAGVLGRNDQRPARPARTWIWVSTSTGWAGATIQRHLTSESVPKLERCLSTLREGSSHAAAERVEPAPRSQRSGPADVVQLPPDRARDGCADAGPRPAPAGRDPAAAGRRADGDGARLRDAARDRDTPARADGDDARCLPVRERRPARGDRGECRRGRAVRGDNRGV